MSHSKNSNLHTFISYTGEGRTGDLLLLGLPPVHLLISSQMQLYNI